MNPVIRTGLIAPALICLVASTALQAVLYRWTDEHGNTHFSDKKPADDTPTYTPSNPLSTYDSSSTPLPIKTGKETYSDLPPYEKRRDTPDIDRLLAVPFPATPNRTSVAAYIQKIYAISRLQKHHLRSDPQVSLLMQVGEEFLHILIRETYSHVGWHTYGIEAVKKLATEQHKPYVFKALPHYNRYAEVIYAKGWHSEIQNELIEGLRNNRGYVPSEWLKAVADFDRDDARQVLIEYFKYGWNNHSTYNIVAGLKNIDAELTEAIPVAWDTARESNKIAMGSLTSKALELGYMPAFRFVMASLLDNANIQKHWFDAHALAIRYTDQSGSARDILAWYKANQNHIRFDPAKSIYKLAE